MEGPTIKAELSLLDFPQNAQNQDCELEEEEYDSEATLSSDEAHEALKDLETLESLKNVCEGKIVESVEDLSGLEKYIECVTVKTEQDICQVRSKFTQKNKSQPTYKTIKENPKQTNTSKTKRNKYKYKILGQYSCSHKGCDKAYNGKWDLENHIKTVHLGQEHKCPSCGKNFSKKANLIVHMRNKICAGAISTVKSEDSRILSDGEGKKLKMKHIEETSPFLTVFLPNS